MEHGASDPILSVLVLMGGGLAAMVLSARTGLNFLLALIVLGVALGPSGLDWATHDPAIELLAELGVAFLLFDIGLHLSAKTLWDARRYLIAFAPLQILACSVLLAVALPFLVQLEGPSWWLAAALSLSSTAVVLQLLRDGGEEQTPIGRAALAALLAQDLFVVLLLVVLPALGGEGGLAALLLPALGQLVGALVACVLLGRYVLAPALGWVARQERAEAFTAAALFFVLSIAWLTHALGLSIALGAFLAGIALAESRYAQLVQAEVAPFRGLLLSLFFLSVGMAIALDAVLDHWGLVLALTLVLIVAKTAATLFAARLIGKGWGSALSLSLTLAQGSEFAFVVLVVAEGEGLIPADLVVPIEAAVVLSIAVTPGLAAIGHYFAARLEESALPPPAALESHPVVLLGFDDTMRALARALDRAGIAFAAFTNDRERAAEGRAQGFDVHYADRERPRGLALAAAGGAAAVVVGVDDDRHGLRLLQEAAAMSTAFPLYGVTGDLAVMQRMQDSGAAEVVRRGETAAAKLAESILTGLDLTARDVAEGVAECSEREEDVLGGALSV